MYLNVATQIAHPANRIWVNTSDTLFTVIKIKVDAVFVGNCKRVFGIADIDSDDVFIISFYIS